jgi:uncharacterized protein YxjI
MQYSVRAGRVDHLSMKEKSVYIDNNFVILGYRGLVHFSVNGALGRQSV